MVLPGAPDRPWTVPLRRSSAARRATGWDRVLAAVTATGPVTAVQMPAVPVVALPRRGQTVDAGGR